MGEDEMMMGGGNIMVGQHVVVLEKILWWEKIK